MTLGPNAAAAPEAAMARLKKLHRFRPKRNTGWMFIGGLRFEIYLGAPQRLWRTCSVPSCGQTRYTGGASVQNCFFLLAIVRLRNGLMRSKRPSGRRFALSQICARLIFTRLLKQESPMPC